MDFSFDTASPFAVPDSPRKNGPRLDRRKLHLVPGTKLLCEVQGDSVILTPEHSRRFVREYVTDPDTGLRVTKSSPEAETVTSDMIKTLLEESP